MDADGVLALYDRHARELLGFFNRRTRDPHLALDLLSETFLAAFEHREQCRARSEGEAAAWLYRIAANQVGFGCSPGVQGVVPGFGGSGSGDRGGGTIVSGMVPDGVVAVTAHYAASSSDPARTITSNVVNNVYVIKVPPNTSRTAFDAVWSVKMSDGRVLTPQQLQVNLGIPGGGGG